VTKLQQLFDAICGDHAVLLPTTTAAVTDLDQLAAGEGPDGVIWALRGARQLDVNIVALAPGGAIRPSGGSDAVTETPVQVLRPPLTPTIWPVM
jgi:hypothetical protein